ncbi:MAG: hypothetical protein WC717_03785 [Candidatus Micrarchaeia archaeon]
MAGRKLHVQAAADSALPDARRGNRLANQAIAPLFAGQKEGLRGQATTEMLVLVGFALVFIIPLAFLFLSASNNEAGKTSLVQAKASARAIADAAGEVYLQGAGARKYVVVNYPQGVAGAGVGDGAVVLTFDMDGRRQDVVATTFANITGNLSGKRSAGLQAIRLVNKDGNYVNVTYAK